MERQEHFPQHRNHNDAILGHFNLPVHVQNMEPDSRVREEDTSYRDNMLPRTFEHLLYGSCYE